MKNSSGLGRRYMYMKYHWQSLRQNFQSYHWETGKKDWFKLEAKRQRACEQETTPYLTSLKEDLRFIKMTVLN